MNLMIDMDVIPRLDERFHIKPNLRFINKTVVKSSINFENNTKEKTLKFDNKGRIKEVKFVQTDTQDDSTTIIEQEIVYLSDYDIGKIITRKYFNNKLFNCTEEIISYHRSLDSETILSQSRIYYYDNDESPVRTSRDNEKIVVEGNEITLFKINNYGNWEEFMVQKLESGKVIEQEDKAAKITIIVK